MAYHLGLRTYREPVGRSFRNYYRWYDTETWALVERLLRARPPMELQQGAQRKEAFSLKLR
ncbi:hypothetical protein AHAS_Ahas12G0185800 [Arachis hypogaea]